MYDQNDQQGQQAQPQNDQNPYGQLPPSNDGALGVAHDQNQSSSMSSNDPMPPSGPPMQQSNDSPISQPSNDSAPVTAEPSSVGDLLSIKQDALQQLNPLVEHLEQNPEEKFKTTMMMIQASDDQTLIKSAYDTATKIADEKARAQALLDVVNEINYFTQQNNS